MVFHVHRIGYVLWKTPFCKPGHICCHTIFHTSVSEYKYFIPSLLRQLIEVTWRTRGKYVCLQHVLTHTGDASQFLKLSPSLPSLVLKAMEQHSVALCVSTVCCVLECIKIHSTHVCMDTQVFILRLELVSV